MLPSKKQANISFPLELPGYKFSLKQESLSLKLSSSPYSTELARFIITNSEILSVSKSTK